MKTTPALLSLLLLLSLSSNPPLLQADNLPNPVKDVAGETLQRDVDYYILPMEGGEGGGVTLGRNRIGTPCPLDVVQGQPEHYKGFPVRFSPVDPKEGVVRELTDLTIKFSGSSLCVQSTVWRMGEFDQSVGRSFVTTGGVKGNPFRIEVDDDGYMLVCSPVCGGIGIFVDSDGTRRLALSNVPFKVRFKRVLQN